MIIFSLFDGSGYMVKDWAEAGHTVFLFNANEGDHGEYTCKIEHPNIHYANRWIEPGFDPVDSYVNGIKVAAPHIIFAFPPCTDMAVSGSRHFAAKREKDPLFQERAVAVAQVAAVLAEKYHAEYMIENPVSVLSSMWRKPNYYFDPYQYGGYLPPDDKHPAFPELITGRDAYQKKTCLWTSKGFNMPAKKAVDKDEGFSTQYKKLGGKSAKTKMIRSLTPRGFAKAVFLENS